MGVGDVLVEASLIVVRDDAGAQVAGQLVVVEGEHSAARGAWLALPPARAIAPWPSFGWLDVQVTAAIPTDGHS
jgi:hypothetical protein